MKRATNCVLENSFCENGPINGMAMKFDSAQRDKNSDHVNSIYSTFVFEQWHIKEALRSLFTAATTFDRPNNKLVKWKSNQSLTVCVLINYIPLSSVRPWRECPCLAQAMLISKKYPITYFLYGVWVAKNHAK